MNEVTGAQHIRIEALRMATDGVGKTRFNPDLVLATARKYETYISTGAIPPPDPNPPAPLTRPAPTGPTRGRGRPRKTAPTGEG